MALAVLTDGRRVSVISAPPGSGKTWWNANCGASFEWVGRAINPYLGFLTGWLMVAGTLIGTLSPVVALGPNVLAVFGAPTGDKWDNVILGTVLTLVMLVISVIGIRLSARTQVSIGIIEYALLITIAVTGLWWVLTRHPGTRSTARQAGRIDTSTDNARP